MPLTDRDFIGCQNENQREFTDISRADLRMNKVTINYIQERRIYKGNHLFAVFFLRNKTLS